MTERDAAAQQPGRGRGGASDADATAAGRTTPGAAGAAAGGATSGNASTSSGGTAGTTKPGGRSSGASDRRGAGAGPAQADRTGRPAAVSRLGWVALTVTVLLLVWQVIYGLTVAGPGLDTREAYTSAWLLISLVLAVGAAVLGIVAVSQRVAPRWPATTALAVGTYVFLVCIATWAGDLISATP